MWPASPLNKLIQTTLRQHKKVNRAKTQSAKKAVGNGVYFSLYTKESKEQENSNRLNIVL